MNNIVLLGSSGSIGRQTLAILRQHRQRFCVLALGAYSNWRRVLKQCREFSPKIAAMVDSRAAKQLEDALRTEKLPVDVVSGASALEEVAGMDGVDTVVAGIVGSAGLASTLAAVRTGKRVLLANKEPLVMTGQLLIESALESQAVLLPIDSEHNAIFQCLPLDEKNYQSVCPDLDSLGVRHLYLTCSGGPFREFSLEAMRSVTPEQACNHPNWEMGQKISVDSATLMNKGLELIEACNLFRCTIDVVDVLIHPQSIIHSMVEYVDGSFLAQLASADMRTPIAHALSWPNRILSGAKRLNPLKMDSMTFSEPDTRRFPCLQTAIDTAENGGTAPTILNAANEISVQAFLKRQIGFLDIYEINDRVLQRMDIEHGADLAQILQVDARARSLAASLVLSRDRRSTA